MEIGDYLDHVRSDGDRLISVARSSPDAPVPSCPDWDVADLVAHVAGVHAWVTTIVAERAQVRRPRKTEDEFEGDFEGLVSEYEVGLERLVSELSKIDPDELIWNWSARAPAPARFWFRRMAQETAIHRVDAELASGAPSPIEPELAADGIDEFLGLVASMLPRQRVEGLSGSLGFVASDVDASWRVELEPDRLERLGPSPVDATVTAPASDLYLWVLHREWPGGPTVEVDGDAAAAGRWGLVRFD